MTKAEWWVKSDDHRTMLVFLGGKASARKLRLFACACCRRVGAYHENVIDLIEGYADGTVKRKEAMSAVEAAIPEGGINAYCSWLFWKDRCYQGADIISGSCLECASLQNQNGPTWDSEREAHAALLRCIFGNPFVVGDPFRPIAIDPDLLTAQVKSLAQAIYDDRAFDGLPILADALAEAGCTDQEILNHCRGPGPHVRGCWVVDRVLGKE